LNRFGQIWLDLGKIWAKVIRFGQNQNLSSPKIFDLLRLCQNVTVSRFIISKRANKQLVAYKNTITYKNTYVCMHANL